ncbi:hypothetical protein DFH28DRAFT_1083155 [Melampsora americana]|nr:hypothetical protein DFH28DRAFT_1083155 [Melampsora americana]
MDGLNKKSCRTMVFIFNLPTLLTAMGVRDLSNTMGHSVWNMGSYASYWTEPFDPALHQEQISQLATEYTSNILFEAPEPSTASTTNIPTWSTGHITPIDDFHTGAYGKSSLASFHYPRARSPEIYNTHDREVNIPSRAESQERHLMHQELGEDTQPHFSRSGSQVETPWRDAYLLNTPSSAPHTDILEKDSWVDGQLAGGYHPEVIHATSHPPGIMGDSPAHIDLLEELSAMSSEMSALKPHHEWNAVDSPIFTDHSFRASEMFGKASSEYNHDHLPEFLQDGTFEKLPSFAQNPGSEGNDHSAPPSIHMNLPSDEHDLGDNQNFESFIMDSTFFHDRFHFTAHDASFPRVAFPVNSPVSNQRHPRETAGDSFNHLSHDAPHFTRHISPHSEENQEFRGYSKLGFLDPPGSFDRPLHPSSLYDPAHESSPDQGQTSSYGLQQSNWVQEIANQPGSVVIHHVDDLPKLERSSMNSHKYSSGLLASLSDKGSGSSEKSLSQLPDIEGRKSFEVANGNERSDDSSRSRFIEWKNNEVDLGRANIGKAENNVILSSGVDEHNLNQEHPTTAFQNRKSTFRDERVRSPPPGHLKRPTRTYQLDSQSSKRKTQHTPSISDEHVGIISQTEKVPPSINNEIHIQDSSTLQSQTQDRSRLQSKPGKTRGSDSGTTSFSKVKKRYKINIKSDKPLDINEYDSSKSAIEKYYAAAWPLEKSQKISLIQERRKWVQLLTK